MNIDNLAMAVNVKRWHTANIEPETVGHHSAVVAIMASHLLDSTLGSEPSQYGFKLAVLRTALAHDLGEYGVGDIPSPVKWHTGAQFNSVLEQLEHQAFTDVGVLAGEEDSTVWACVRLADYLAGALHAATQAAKGCQFAFTVIDRYRKLFEVYGSDPTSRFEKCAAAVFSDIVHWLDVESKGIGRNA